MSLKEGTTAGELALRAATGDQDAFRELFEQFNMSIYRYSFAQLGRQDLAQEATQEVFLGVWRNLPSFRNEHEGSFGGWLFGIARNVIGSMRRRNAKNEDLPTEHALDGQVEFEGDLVSKKVLHDALSELPEVQREVVVLRFLVGLSLREVGESMGTTEGAVTSAQLRGLRRLRRTLEAAQ